MIKAVRSDRPSFKTVKFEKGFNVVLADRIKESSERDSRNGLGKTALIEIIHFCLGSSFQSNRILRRKELENWTFILDFAVNNKDVTVYRNTYYPSRVKLDGDFSDWPIKPDYDKDGYYMRTQDWNNVLGYLVFSLPEELWKQKYTPTFRSLISYFVRRDVGAFQKPFKHHPQQREWDMQVNNAYLLGLNWKYASEFQQLKDSEKTVRELKKAAKEGWLEGYIGSLGSLEAEEIRLEEGISELEEELRNFKVHPQYREMEKEANLLTEEIHKTTNQMIIDQQLLTAYQKNISEDDDVSLEEIEKIYQHLGFFFPEGLSRKLRQVVAFHKQIISNRKDYLATEINEIKEIIDSQQYQRQKLLEKRADLLGILETHGALDEYRELNNRLAVRKQGLEEMRNKIKNLRMFEIKMSELKIKKQELLQKTRRDYEERKYNVEKAIKFFNRNSEFLYSEPGVLSIDITENGYRFEVEIRRAESQGVGYMKVFCYDLLLNQLRTGDRDRPYLLIHDSTIFDGVDERQISRAMELAAKKSQEDGFQYICAINSDVVPFGELSDDFQKTFKDSVRITLTDATEDGGLFGIRF